MNENDQYLCKLCGNYYDEIEMSDEHYPARCTGNDDIVALDLCKMMDLLTSDELYSNISKKLIEGKSMKEVSAEIFDNELSEILYPKGRTTKTLCKNCNIFLGKYDEAYLKFFKADGNEKSIKGFQMETKYRIIKAIYAKFLSVPEAKDEQFDFVDFIKDKNSKDYNGNWNLYFIKRDFSSDLFGMKDIGTGKAMFDEGVVYELSDDKFIFNLMNFEKHSCYEMTNIFDILNKDYKLIEGVGEFGGYHASILMPRLLSENEEFNI